MGELFWFQTHAMERYDYIARSDLRSLAWLTREENPHDPEKTATTYRQVDVNGLARRIQDEARARGHGHKNTLESARKGDFMDTDMDGEHIWEQDAMTRFDLHANQMKRVKPISLRHIDRERLYNLKDIEALDAAIEKVSGLNHRDAGKSHSVNIRLVRPINSL